MVLLIVILAIVAIILFVVLPAFETEESRDERAKRKVAGESEKGASYNAIMIVVFIAIALMATCAYLGID